MFKWFVSYTIDTLQWKGIMCVWCLWVQPRLWGEAMPALSCTWGEWSGWVECGRKWPVHCTASEELGRMDCFVWSYEEDEAGHTRLVLQVDVCFSYVIFLSCLPFSLLIFISSSLLLPIYSSSSPLTSLNCYTPLELWSYWLSDTLQMCKLPIQYRSW